MRRLDTPAWEMFVRGGRQQSAKTASPHRRQTDRKPKMPVLTANRQSISRKCQSSPQTERQPKMPILTANRQAFSRKCHCSPQTDRPSAKNASPHRKHTYRQPKMPVLTANRQAVGRKCQSSPRHANTEPDTTATWRLSADEMGMSLIISGKTDYGLETSTLVWSPENPDIVPVILSHLLETFSVLIFTTFSAWGKWIHTLTQKQLLAKTILQGTVKGGKKTRQTEEEVGRQHQGMDRHGVHQVPEGSGEQGKMEETDFRIICGAPTTLAVKG